MAEYIINTDMIPVNIPDKSEVVTFFGEPVQELVRCKDCKHRPRRIEENGGNRFNLEFPDYRCPCQCDDPWYNWMPDDDWFCGNGERKEE